MSKIFKLFSSTILLLSFLVPSFGYDAETITMYKMNSATAFKRIKKGYFKTVFRGFGTRDKQLIHRDELLGFHFMLDTDVQSWGLRKLLTKYKKKGLSSKVALQKARKDHSKQLVELFKTMTSTKELYENRANKKKWNYESHFIFTSPRIGVAKFYGPIILVVEEKRPRGMDLNSIAKDSKYYNFARFIKNFFTAKHKLIISDYFIDADEYVIPSYISPRDVSGLIVHNSSPVVIANRIAVPQPSLKRVYKKRYINGLMVIDVFDKEDLLIERLTTANSSFTKIKNVRRSKEKLPSYIRKAWNRYVLKRRQKR